MATGAAEMMFRCVFNGSISMQDGFIERRPYHRNCKCALHKLKGGCSSTCSSRTTKLPFPKKQAWGNCCLSLSASKLSSQSPLLLPNGSFTRSIEISVNSAHVEYEREAEHS
ncbi:hypothetical protein HRI_004394200 [Hibiscus trionum]|uniref:Uncharacterized protein n=1 Tax=Hibiscus trionum TaxID=183268 RepID=A0A9W7J350_HIBTR|nr:hypothetical protein HRI_004394200 [Hibiscus trionum]